jgi:undecaprenyl phosphate N,N'-diacetylbacillosamine 1-phosphate transferase
LYRYFFKRLIDLILALIGFTLFFPFFIIITIALICFNQGKAFFTQERPGKRGKSFYVVKFKTMNDQCDSNGVLLPDHQRLTPVGRFIRSTSLDEVPQLINVIKGDMALIGPRPLLIEYLPIYSKQQARRHEVRPGITGWAQINGRNTISWQQKFEYDVWYVEHISFLLDLKILLLTIKKVFIREGINSETSATMEPFRGNGIA